MHQDNLITRVALSVGLAKRTVHSVRMQTIHGAATSATANTDMPVARQQPQHQIAQGVPRPVARPAPSPSSGTSQQASPALPPGGPAPRIQDGLPSHGRATDINTVIPASACFEGDFQIEESLVLQGVVRGNYTVIGDHQLIVDTSGGIYGNIKAQTVVIAGTVEGNVYADRVMLLETGIVRGDIEYVTIGIKEGATIDGIVARKIPNVVGEVDGASATVLRAVPSPEEFRPAVVK